MHTLRTRRPALTVTETLVLASLEQYLESHEFPPTYRELAEYGGRSLSATHRCIQLLRQKGYVNQGPIRTMKVLP